MGTVLGLIAVFGRAGLPEFESHFDAPAVAAFREKVVMVADAEVEAAYPARWVGKVTVETMDGRLLTTRVDEPKGDPGNTLTRSELAEKALRLAAFAGAATAEEMEPLVRRILDITSVERIGPFFMPSGVDARADPALLSLRSR
jgi:2-methylcitrate dehydratase PrpD